MGCACLHAHGLGMHAGHGSEEHERRQRLLALTGWSAEVLKPEEARAAGSSGPVRATCAALRCAMCDARAGLWNFLPEMAAAGHGSASKLAPGVTRPAPQIV